MLRTSLIALMAVTLIACDDEEDIAAVEQEVEVTTMTDETAAADEAGGVVVGTGATTQDTETAEAGEEEVEQVSTTTDSDEAMERYREWLLGTWGVDGQCDSRVVGMEESRMTLPGGITCDELSVEADSEEKLVVAARRCEGTDSADPVEIEVSRTENGVTFTRGDRDADLTRCE